jgi:hypothetical protein
MGEEEEFRFPPQSPDLPDGFKIDVMGVLSKVNLRDKPIIAIVLFHILIFGLGLLARSHRLWRTAVFAVCVSTALVTEKLGAFLQSHWSAFGFSANYFDENGVFLLFFFALPPLFTAIVLFSHLVGDILGRIVDRYFGRRRAPPPAAAEETKHAEDGKMKSE